MLGQANCIVLILIGDVFFIGAVAVAHEPPRHIDLLIQLSSFCWPYSVSERPLGFWPVIPGWFCDRLGADLRAPYLVHSWSADSVSATICTNRVDLLVPPKGN